MAKLVIREESLPHKTKQNQQPALCFLAAITLTTVLGSIHAFSVFLLPFEALLQTGWTQISLIYSGALICLTISVLFGHRIYSRLGPPTLGFVACLVAAVGIVIAGNSDSFGWSRLVIASYLEPPMAWLWVGITDFCASNAS
jgi:hypothetical protein